MTEYEYEYRFTEYEYEEIRTCNTIIRNDPTASRSPRRDFEYPRA